jgi:hypothetical protein
VLQENSNPNHRIHQSRHSSTQMTSIGQSRQSRSSPPFKIWLLKEVSPTNSAPSLHSLRGPIIMSVTCTLGMNWSESVRALHRGKQRLTAHEMPSRTLKRERSANVPSLRKGSLHTCVITMTSRVFCRTLTRRPSQLTRSVPSS